MFTPRPLLRGLPRSLRLTPLQRTLTTAPRRPPTTHAHTYPSSSTTRSTLTAQKRRQTTLVVCAAVSMASLWFLATSVDIEHRAESPPGTTPIKPGTPVILHSAAEKAAGVELVPSGTTSVPAFPKTLRVKGTEYALVGLGIRTVSFLSIEVYVVGMYVAADDLATVQAALARRVGEGVTAATAGEREVLRGELVVDGETFWEGLLGPEGPGVRSVLRIVPTRNTDYQHLRDGWVRGIQSRTSKNAAYDDEAFSHALTSFKQAFGQKKSVPKQKTLLLVRDANGALECLFDPTGRNDGRVGGDDAEKDRVVVLGSVADRRLSTALWMCYVGAGKVASEPARRSVVEGLVALAERPVGTVGSTMA
ncbi:chalcone-flavanone isomerase-domain-containing protein [Morchella snyderi]|nr:chalcone-flavanone isomerase-domain-containing protein [Morchella snyderi]